MRGERGGKALVSAIPGRTLRQGVCLLELLPHLSHSSLNFGLLARCLPQHVQDLIEALLLRLPAHTGEKLRRGNPFERKRLLL